MTVREQEILAAFVKHKHYRQAGEVVGVSKQRVEQLVKKYLSAPVVHAAYLELRTPVTHLDEFCTMCHRSFRAARFQARGLCNACYTHSRKTGVVKRRLLLPPTCSMCHRLLIPRSHKGGSWRTERRGTDYCGWCYTKRPEYKAMQKRYYYASGGYEQHKATMRDYYRRNREYLLAASARRSAVWQRENKERVAYNQAQYRLRKRLNKLLIPAVLLTNE